MYNTNIVIIFAKKGVSMEMTFDKILEDKRLWAEGMMKSSAIEFLEAHQSSTPSRWHEEAQWRRDNEYWLNYSRSITLQVL